ncbi:MAG: hypothetical protein PHG99_05395 [Erysipelotrichaceae bacterium]|nr:hypothetical protein [Erysipelotrichaceae bacterium]MDD4642917.1 hypothetical protein [Erysipelotrichaceae bacterium]
MTDSLTLLKYMNQANITIDELANELNMDSKTLLNKMDKQDEFYSVEIQTICEILDIPNEKRKDIFFD